MRAVARAVGMTAPGLYRYVASQDDLLDQLGGSLYDELIDELVHACDAVDPGDPGGRLTAAAWAFRSWALAHRQEYGLLFASPLTAAAHANEGRTHEAGQRFGALFAELFAALWQAGSIVEPDLSDVDPALLEMLRHSEEISDELPLGIRYLYVRQWARLYGMVTIEAFGHLSWAVADSSALFQSMLVELAGELGVALGPNAQLPATRTANSDT